MQELEIPVRAAASKTGTAMAILIREVEMRLLALFAEGKLFGTVHTCIGQEWVGVAVAAGLEKGDIFVSNHRCHGHFLAHTGNVEGLIAEIMGKQTGVCGGLGGSQHLCDVERGFFSNGVQGGMMPVAAGVALSLKLKNSKNIAVVFIGDGTLGEGAVYETFNLASKWEVPLLIVLENNAYAQSTAQAQTLAGTIEARASAFGIETRAANTWDTDELCEVARECVERVREQCRPVFLKVDCDRLMAHSKGDDNRDPVELQRYWKRDQIRQYLAASPLEGSEHLENARRIVEDAVAAAEHAPFAQLSAHHGNRRGLANVSWSPAKPSETVRVVVSIRESLQRNMRLNAKIVLFGEDIESPYGGAFKVTKGLSVEFVGRVTNTPICEAAIVGMGNGLALQGFIPVCEIMFGDFLTLASDQLINHSSKFHHMYNGQVAVPLVVRTPMGGRRGYGPTHSQSLEKHFLGIPHTQVLALNHRYDPGLLYDTLFATVDRATIVIENKLLYTMHLNLPVPAGFVVEHSDELYPSTRIRPMHAPDVTVFCYGGMLPYVEQAAAAAFDEHEIVVEVICPVQLYPLNPSPVIESIRHTHLLLIVEEGIGFASVGSELTTQVMEEAPTVLHRLHRLAAPEFPIPSSASMEEMCLPGATAILKAIKDIVHHA